MNIERAYRIGLVTNEEYNRWLVVKRVKDVLGRSVAPCDYQALLDEWAAFCREPEKYANTPVVECVNHWLDERINRRWGL